MLTFGSLFSGIGGIDLGLERAGMRCLWQSEIDPYCCAVLNKHWPEVPNVGDITKVDPATLPPVDLVCGGFPCQPVSLAGKREGKKDPRWLWPEFARVVRALRPRYVLVENVPGLRTVNEGAAFAEVLSDLARYGYDAEWASLPAAAFGAPHLRYRIFLVAYSRSVIQSQQQARTRSAEIDISSGDSAVGAVAHSSQHMLHGSGTSRPEGRLQLADSGDVPDAFGERLEEQGGIVTDANQECPAPERSGALVAYPQIFTQRESHDQADAEPAGTRPWPLFGSGSWWAVEPDVGRVAHGVPARVGRLRALGNAVVPQVAEWVGRRIIDFHERVVQMEAIEG